jgi:NRAMP (natural resistance-associated macrophage protein)-like metal ion transporter
VNTSKGRPKPVRSRYARLSRMFEWIGPGFVTGASDDDPSGIGTYAVAGASFGFATLWTALVTFPLMAAVQFICAKVGMVTGRGLAGVLRKHYSIWMLYAAVLALLVANTINAAADIGAIAAAIKLLVSVPAPVIVVLVSLLILAIQIWGSYRRIASLFKWLALSLLAYIGAAFFARPDWGEVLHGTLAPAIQWNSKFLGIIVAILGTTISPYLFFWQASQEVEEDIANGKKTVTARQGATNRELKQATWDVNLGMLFSNLVMYFIILATAATLYKSGKNDIQSATDAAMALQPFVGKFATTLFALGLVGAGMLTVPVLTGSSAYAIAETFGWRYGLDEKVHRAPQFYALIAVSTLFAMLLNFTRINPITALVWSAVLNGFLAPPLLVLVMMISSNRNIMGKRVNGTLLNILGWFTAGLMSVAAIALVITATSGTP